MREHTLGTPFDRLLAALVALVCVLALAPLGIASPALADDASAAEVASQTSGTTLNADQQALDELVRAQIVLACENSYVTLHATLGDPAAWGIDAQAVAEEAGWQSAGSFTDFEDMLASAQELVDDLVAIDRSQLDEERLGVYDKLLFEAKINLAACDPKFDYYAQAFLSGSGFYEVLPYALVDWELRDESDVRGLVSLLEDTDRYVGELLDYAQAQADRGLLVVDAQAAIDACQIVVDDGADSAVLQALLERVDALGLDEATASAYEAEVTQAYERSYVKAFADGVAFFTKVLDEGLANEDGYAGFEYGPEYYELLLQYATGTTMTVDEAWDYAYEAMEGALDDLILALCEDETALDVLEEGGVSLGFTSYEEIVEYVSARMGGDFLDVGEVDYEISDLPDSIAAAMGNALAYFLLPTIDDEDAVRTMRVNPLTSDLSSIETYVTVAHEGFPGHMYQYESIYQSETLRMGSALIGSLGSTEGYATYASLESLDYLDELTDAQRQVYRANVVWSWSVTVLMEIGVNAYGWDVDDLLRFYVDCGLLYDESEIDAEVRAEAQGGLQLCVQSAGTLEAYGVGLIEFEQLKTDAQERLGDAYADTGFNEAVLSRGITTFASIGEAVDAWVEETLAASGEAEDATPGEDLDFEDLISLGSRIFADILAEVA